jgi:segregation and condensation protein B
MSEMDDRISAAPEETGMVIDLQPMSYERSDVSQVETARGVFALSRPEDVFAPAEREEAPPRPARGNGSRPVREPVPLRRVLEAVLFATDRPVTVEQLLCAVPDESPVTLERELQDMAGFYRQSGYGFQLCESGEGFWLRTDPDLHEYVHRFLIGKRRTRLSRAAMETLAIVAYRQPITRGEMEEIRGVDCGQVLHTLMERNLVTVRGRSQALGRPLLYGSTEEFLHYFGIKSLADLPSPEELESLIGPDPQLDPEIREAVKAQGLAEDELEPPALPIIEGPLPAAS